VEAISENEKSFAGYTEPMPFHPGSFAGDKIGGRHQVHKALMAAGGKCICALI